jgi:hypothetical protein
MPKRHPDLGPDLMIPPELLGQKFVLPEPVKPPPAPKTPLEVLAAALVAPNPNYHPGHVAAQLDAAEAILKIEDRLSGQDAAALELLRGIAYGQTPTPWSARVRAAKILLAGGAS